MSRLVSQSARRRLEQADATLTVVNSESLPASSESVHDALDAVSEASDELRSAQPGRIGDGCRVCWEDERRRRERVEVSLIGQESR